MNTLKPWGWALLAAVATAVAAAQEPPAAAPTAAPTAAPAKRAPRSTAQIDAGEPRADTSAPPPSTAPTTAPPGKPAKPVAPARPGAPDAKSAAGAKATGGVDRLDLGTATVTGDREQPKVMYIVPWKKSDIGDQSGKPMNSLLDEALAPVDRDEFKREVAYYDAVRADAPQNGASKQGEK